MVDINCPERGGLNLVYPLCFCQLLIRILVHTEVKVLLTAYEDSVAVPVCQGEPSDIAAVAAFLRLLVHLEQRGGINRIDSYPSGHVPVRIVLGVFSEISDTVVLQRYSHLCPDLGESLDPCCRLYVKGDHHVTKAIDDVGLSRPYDDLVIGVHEFQKHRHGDMSAIYPPHLKMLVLVWSEVIESGSRPFLTGIAVNIVVKCRGTPEIRFY